MPFKNINNNYIEYSNYFAGVLQIDPREFSLLSEYRQNQIIDENFGKIIREISDKAKASIVKIDRKHSGSRRAIVHQRRCKVANNKGEISLRLILDRYSMELFINDGEQVMSMVVLTDIKAEGISFRCQGELLMDVTMHELERA